MVFILTWLFAFVTNAETAPQTEEPQAEVPQTEVTQTEVPQTPAPQLKKPQITGQVAASKDISAFTNWPIILLVLIGMIGLILSLAWSVKRFGGMNFSGNREMKVVTSIALGARERIALIDIKGQQFLIGVTTQQINHLHSFDEAIIPLEGDKNATNQSDFALKLQSILNPVKAHSRADNPSGNSSAPSSDNATQKKDDHAS